MAFAVAWPQRGGGEREKRRLGRVVQCSPQRAWERRQLESRVREAQVDSEGGKKKKATETKKKARPCLFFTTLKNRAGQKKKVRQKSLGFLLIERNTTEKKGKKKEKAAGVVSNPPPIRAEGGTPTRSLLTCSYGTHGAVKKKGEKKSMVNYHPVNYWFSSSERKNFEVAIIW